MIATCPSALNGICLPAPQKTITGSAGRQHRAAIFNNTAHIWNHIFYWKGIKPIGGGEPPTALKQKMVDSFCSMDACKVEGAPVRGDSGLPTTDMIGWEIISFPTSSTALPTKKCTSAFRAVTEAPSPIGNGTPGTTRCSARDEVLHRHHVLGTIPRQHIDPRTRFLEQTGADRLQVNTGNRK